LSKVGIRSVMITGDNPLTAAAIAAEAGIIDFIGQARPEAKARGHSQVSKRGHMVAMIGDGTNDAPALAQADVAVAMNAGLRRLRKLPTWLIWIPTRPSCWISWRLAKQILITRGALTTFSVANDVSKYFTILPAMFAYHYPMLNVLNIMQLANAYKRCARDRNIQCHNHTSAHPTALRGVRYTPSSAEDLLRRNMLIYGLGGLIVPFIGIKLMDMMLVLLHLE